MYCSNCGSDHFDGLTCFECGCGSLIGPGPNIDQFDDGIMLLSSTKIDDLIPLFEMPWKNLCPMCKKRTFNGWDCTNPNCNYSIPEKMRKMHACILSPEEAAQKRKELGIP